MPNSDAESDNEVEILSAGNVLSNIPNRSNIYKENAVNFNPIGL